MAPRKRPGQVGNGAKHPQPALPIPHVQRQAAAAAAKQQAQMKDDKTATTDTLNTKGSATDNALTTVQSQQADKDVTVPSTGPSSAANGGSEQQDGSSKDGAKPKPAEDPPATTPNTSSGRRIPASLPPEFHPSNTPYKPFAAHPQNGPGPGAYLIDGRSYSHSSQQSNSGPVYGAPHISGPPTPARHLSGDFTVPPGMPPPVDPRRPYTGSSPGFPPPMDPRNGMIRPGSFDNYRVPSMEYPHMNPRGNYPAYPGPYGFHGPQTPAMHQANGDMHRQYGPSVMHNGVPGLEGHEMPLHDRGMMNGIERGRNSMSPPQDGGDALVQHLQKQLGNHEFADCFLELRRGHEPYESPIRVPCHRSVLSRSDLLAEIIRNHPPHPASQTIVLEAQDYWVDANAFYMACQRLYGFPLLPVPPPPSDGATVPAGSIHEKFTFALSYAAAGYLLGWEEVVTRGCNVAGLFINASTVEIAMSFALSQYKDMGLYENLKYEQNSRILLGFVIKFLMGSVPPDFQLDTSVTDGQGFSRLPHLAPASQLPTSDAQGGEAPFSVRGKHPGHAKSASRSMNIRFGDLSVAKEAGNNASGNKVNGASGASEKSQPTADTTARLSRILLNLPFGFLMLLADIGRDGTHGCLADRDSWHRIMKDVVRERERRRVCGTEIMRARKTFEHENIVSMLRSPYPIEIVPWNLLGWKEEAVLHKGHSPASLTITRRWAPLEVDIQGFDPAMAYP